MKGEIKTFQDGMSTKAIDGHQASIVKGTKRNPMQRIEGKIYIIMRGWK
jgi:hypothetical protein